MGQEQEDAWERTPPGVAAQDPRSLMCRTSKRSQTAPVRRFYSEVSGRFEFGDPKTWVRLPRFVTEMLAARLESVPADPDALVFIAGGHTSLRNSKLPAAALAAGPPGRRAAGQHSPT